MNYHLKNYEAIGLDIKHIETIEKVYDSVIEANYSFQRYPKRIKNIIKHLVLKHHNPRIYY